MAPPKGSPRPIGAGRAPGTPNKITTLLKEATLERIGKTPTKHDSLEKMREIAITLHGLMADQLRAATVKDENGKAMLSPGADVKMLAEIGAKAQMAWDRVAKYEHPTLASVHVTREPIDPGILSDDELAQLEGIVAKASLIRSDKERAGETLQ